MAGQQGLFVIGLGTTLTSLRWNLNDSGDKKVVAALATVDQDKAGNRWNDAKADVNGYLWAGKRAQWSVVDIYTIETTYKFFSQQSQL